MKAKLILFLTVILCYHTQAQIGSIFADEFPDSSSTRIGIVGEYGIGSNNLTNEFLGKFYKGGYIDKALKDQILAKTKNHNRLGGDVNYGIYAAFKCDSLFHRKNLSLFFSVKDRMHFDAAFSKDLYKVGFYGNAAYAGKLADFSGFNMTLLRYQQIQVGLFSSKLDSAARWGVGVSFLKGEQYASVYAKKAELFTSEDGQYIDFNTNIAVAQSDTSKKGIGAFNGFGASVDIYFEAPFRTKIGDSKLRVSVSDIGLIQFNSKSLYMNQDSLFHYSGFTVNNIYDLQDSTLATNASQDSIVNSIAPFKQQSVSVTLPAVLDLSFETKLGKHFELAEGIHYVFNGNYKLRMYLRGNFVFNDRFSISATASYGGYSTFNYGVGLFANIGKGFVVYAGSHNIEGFIVPKRTTAQGAYISLIKNFK